MKWLYILLFTVSLIVFSNTCAFSDGTTLFGQAEQNQLDELLKGKAINCPQQSNYAQAISKLLAGYDISTVLKSTAQKTTLQSSTAIITSNTKTARTIQDILANHDLTIIVDRSGSMATQDCPGGLSRWQWCSSQALQLAQAAAQASSKITVMFFNSDLQIFDNVNPKNLPALFNSYAPAGGTVLSAPLVAQLDRYFATRSKPLIIVVITDGVPQDTWDLAPMISDASDSLHYVGEVTISFLLISNQVDAAQFKRLLGELDGGNIQNGGMVDVIAFKDIFQKGIKQTLFDELKTIKLATNKSKPSTAEKFAIGRSLSMTSLLNPFPSYSGTAIANTITNPFPARSMSAALSQPKSR